MGINPYARYQKIQVETAGQGKLLLMLYAGALRFLGSAKRSLGENDLENVNCNLLRVQDIVTELISALNFEAGKVAEGLYQLYDYIHYLLVQGNVKKEVLYLDQAETLLMELQDFWKEILGEKQVVKQGKDEMPAGPAGGSGIPGEIDRRINISG